MSSFTVPDRERRILRAISVRLFTICKSNKGSSDISSLAVPIDLSAHVGFVRLASILPRSDRFSAARIGTKIEFSCP
jgi:hypothetical protein